LFKSQYWDRVLEIVRPGLPLLWFFQVGLFSLGTLQTSAICGSRSFFPRNIANFSDLWMDIAVTAASSSSIVWLLSSLVLFDVTACLFLYWYSVSDDFLFLLTVWPGSRRYLNCSKAVQPGTIIHSDQWRAYNSIQSELNLQHGSVNHSVNFIDPDTGVHTQMKCLKLGSVLLCAPGCCRKLGYHSCPNDHTTFFRLGSCVVDC
jgi:hypothetical protein